MPKIIFNIIGIIIMKNEKLSHEKCSWKIFWDLLSIVSLSYIFFWIYMKKSSTSLDEFWHY